MYRMKNAPSPRTLACPPRPRGFGSWCFGFGGERGGNGDGVGRVAQGFRGALRFVFLLLSRCLLLNGVCFLRVE